jgi:hypothetical protein
MRAIALVFVLSLLSAGTAARSEDAVACDNGGVALRGLNDADLDARYCAISKLRREAGRRMMDQRSPENDAESNRCISVLADIAREQLKRYRGAPRCGEQP